MVSRVMGVLWGLHGGLVFLLFRFVVVATASFRAGFRGTFEASCLWTYVSLLGIFQNCLLLSDDTGIVFNGGFYVGYVGIF